MSQAGHASYPEAGWQLECEISSMLLMNFLMRLGIVILENDKVTHLSFGQEFMMEAFFNMNLFTGSCS